MDRLDYLINYLLKENKEIKIDKIPKNKEDKKKLYRSLCNIREPKPIDKQYIQIENEYLQEELQNKKITKIEDINSILEIVPQSTLKHKNKICLWQGDITTLKINAIVNAGNSQGLGCFVPLHSCIDNQINSNAGVALRLECNEIMKEKNYNLKTSEVIYTKGYNLPSKYIIQTVGPIIYGEVNKIEEKQLADCYINSLRLAIKIGIKNIAFPCISTGEFRFPKDLASKIAIATVDEFLDRYSDEFEKIVFNVFADEDYNIYLKNLGENYEGI